MNDGTTRPPGARTEELRRRSGHRRSLELKRLHARSESRRMNAEEACRSSLSGNDPIADLERAAHVLALEGSNLRIRVEPMRTEDARRSPRAIERLCHLRRRNERPRSAHVEREVSLISAGHAGEVGFRAKPTSLERAPFEPFGDRQREPRIIRVE